MTRSWKRATASGSPWSRSTASAPSSYFTSTTAAASATLLRTKSRQRAANLGPVHYRRTRSMPQSGGRMVAWLSQTAIQGERVSERVPVGVAARLSRYLQVLTQAKKMGKERISSQEMSDYTNINATQIRRDLSAFGKFGKRGVGYSVDGLLGRDPEDPAHAGAAQHRARRCRQARSGDCELADLRRARHQHRRRVRQGSRARRSRHRLRAPCWTHRGSATSCARRASSSA